MSPHYKKISLTISAIFLIVACLLFIFLYKKVYSKNTAADQGGLAWQTEANQREQINSLDTSLKSIDPERAALESHFAQSADIVPFLDTIEGLGASVKANATVTSVDILNDNTGLLVGIKATGSFSATYAFLTLLENSPYVLDFNEVDIEKDPSTATDPVTGKTLPASWTLICKVQLLSFVQ